MSESLEIGSCVKTVLGETAEVIKYLTEGKYSNIYIVDYKKQEKVLIWYKKEYLESKPEPEAFYQDINQNLDPERPAYASGHPLDITEYKKGETFGFIMNHRPDDHDELIKEMPYNCKAPEPAQTDDHDREDR